MLTPANPQANASVAPNVPPLPPDGPLFVVSLWRAGSSLLYALLNKHPDVALMYEADFVLLQPAFLQPAFRKSTRSGWAQRWEILNSSLSRHNLSESDFPEVADFPSAFAATHRLYAQRQGARIWGDKSPHYYDRLTFLADCFPGARFIIVWRDLFQTTSSMVRAGAAGSSYFSKPGMPLRAILGYRTLKQQCDSLLAGGFPVHQLNYEDLVRDPAVIMKNVCAFLGISYRDELSTIEGADRSATHSGEHHRLLRGNAIVAQSRPDALTPALRNKIEHYHSWYRKLYAGTWPPYPQDLQKHGTPVPEFPSPLRRIADHIAYRSFRTWDALVELTFCLAPLRLLSRHRQRKEKLRAYLAPTPSDLK
jgi:hypothetical protein